MPRHALKALMQCSLLFLASSKALAFDFTVQAGANHGLLAAGVRLEWLRLQSSFTYGLTPSRYGAALTTQANMKFNFRVVEESDFRYYVGGGLLVNHSQFTQFSLPSKYPKGYYPPDAYYFTHQHTFYYGRWFIELSIIDYYIEVLARNEPGDVRFLDTMSLGIGVDF